MPKVGSLGLDMMVGTCTVQVNLDFSSEVDMIRKFCAGLALQPIATAQFANSPFTEGKPNGYLSMRSQMWTNSDNHRASMHPFVFDVSFGRKKHIDCAGMSFRDFMAGKLPHLPSEYPTLNDWENHLRTIYPEVNCMVRLKRYLEMRGADGGLRGSLCALPAFWRHATKRGKTHHISGDRVGCNVRLKSFNIRKVTVTLGTIVSDRPHTKVGGVELGPEFLEVSVEVPLMRSESLVKPHGRFKK